MLPSGKPSHELASGKTGVVQIVEEAMRDRKRTLLALPVPMMAVQRQWPSRGLFNHSKQVGASFHKGGEDQSRYLLILGLLGRAVLCIASVGSVINRGLAHQSRRADFAR